MPGDTSAGGASVRAGASGDIDACVEIVRGLPEFFTDDVADSVRADLAAHPSWVATTGDVVGFAVARRHGAAAAEILWAAIARGQRRRRIGTRMVDRVLDDLRADGVHLVEVKTLDPSAGYAPYVATHAFWVARGFVQIDTIDPLPGWQPGNPAAILVAALTTTR